MVVGLVALGSIHHQFSMAVDLVAVLEVALVLQAEAPGVVSAAAADLMAVAPVEVGSTQCPSK